LGAASAGANQAEKFGAARIAKQIFRARTADDKQNLKLLRDAITPVISADTLRNAAAAACDALNLMCGVKGISTGVATRLLVLARPDTEACEDIGAVVYRQ
jgi:hypothetical protein